MEEKKTELSEEQLKTVDGGAEPGEKFSLPVFIDVDSDGEPVG